MIRPASGRPGRGGPPVVGAFFLTGIVTVLLGPIIPELRAGWNLTQAQAAALFLAQFTSSALGSVISSFHLRRSLAAGYLLVGAGLATLASGGWRLAPPAMALTGLGLGLLIPASNLFVAHRHPTRRGASLAKLNLSWSLGAVSSPLLIAAARDRVPLEHVLLGLAAAALLTGLGLWKAVSDDPPTAAAAKPDTGGQPGRATLALLAAMFLLYVGAENAVGGWLVTLADELGGERSIASLVIGSSFWGAILVGRGMTPLALRPLSEPTLYRLCLTLAGAGTLLLVVAGSRPLAATGAVLAGLGMAPLYPLTVSTLAAATVASRSRTTGWVLACGGLGGAALPWLTGWLGGGGEPFHRGFLVPLAALGGLAALSGLERRRGR